MQSNQVAGAVCAVTLFAVGIAALAKSTVLVNIGWLTVLCDRTSMRHRDSELDENLA